MWLSGPETLHLQFAVSRQFGMRDSKARADGARSTGKGAVMKSRRVFLLLPLLLSSTFGLAFAQDERQNRRDLVREVGSPESFQNNVKFLGAVGSDLVYFLYNCEGHFPCVELNPPPQETDFDMRDI